MPRLCKFRRVAGLPQASYFKPQGIPLRDLDEVTLSVEGLEALRLSDREGLTMAEAAEHMGISRHTFGRVLREAHRSIATALLDGLALRIEGGRFTLESPGEAPDEPHRAQNRKETP